MTILPRENIHKIMCLLLALTDYLLFVVHTADIMAILTTEIRLASTAAIHS